MNENLLRLEIGYGKKIDIESDFPPTQKRSAFGLGLTEDQLQQRCYLLNKWMQAVFNAYHLFPEEAQVEQLINDKVKLLVITDIILLIGNNF